ncbi:helix-turn-helix domain-containing protein [Nostoc sp. JL23]|uniref:helix-turn-helix domain-containing protein n=1 Tax=Nostoc sp. JL23 TaxID=2815394 RepID=UPI001DFDAD9F|nr:helix-turn-helix domain-containing protein [Nostoc sp. JL23]MBN3875221.1 helix-turn-helix domain-containing protein [Nostoc sp. JL23]
MSRKKDSDKIKLAEAKYITGEAPEEIAAALGVTRRTIDRWAKDGNWDSHRENNKSNDNFALPNGKANRNVIQLQPKPREKLGGTKLREAVARRRDTSEDLDDVRVVESAIANIHDSLPGAELGKGSMATALVKLIELKRKLKPETVADLVERAIELDIGPEEFLSELKNAWQRRA